MDPKHDADLWKILKRLPTDYSCYGGEVVRWEEENKPYPDCSCGCKYFIPLEGSRGADWGVCSKENAPRAGLLTWEHQTGVDCFEDEDPF